MSGVSIRKNLAGLAPYRQGAQANPDAFKLSSNENPFSTHPVVSAAIADAIGANRYPDATALTLREALAEFYGTDERPITPDEIHIGAGSVSIIAQLLTAVCEPGTNVVYAWRSFEAYPSLTMIAGAEPRQIPLTAEAGHDLPAMAAAIDESTRAVILCTPNNPTGPIITSDEFNEFLAQVPSDVLIILDEAYAEFVTDEHAVDGIRQRAWHKHPNVVVLRTFSKAYGLAGLRVGYAFGNSETLDLARVTAIPLSVTGAAAAAAIASLQPDVVADLNAQVAELVARRVTLVEGLRAQGWSVPDTQANFVWLGVGADAPEWAGKLAEHGIIVRPLPGDSPTTGGIRISIGEAESIERVLEALGQAPDA